jgi:C4-dicarboxylate-specific signal transduction histidine kinase
MGKSSTHKLVGDIASNLNYLPKTAKEIAKEIDRDSQSVKAYLQELKHLPNIKSKEKNGKIHFYRTDNKEAQVVEKLADLEHRQWMHWSQYVAREHNISEELKEKWDENWKPYSELSEEMKEKDRKWARKSLKIIKENGDFLEIEQ